jgi:hypothetical protein
MAFSRQYASELSWIRRSFGKPLITLTLSHQTAQEMFAFGGPGET